MSAPSADPFHHRRASLVSLFFDDHPMARALGMEFVKGDPEGVVCRLPHTAALEYHAGAGLAPGVLVTVLDGMLGLSVMMRVEKPQAIATIELKIDYIEGEEAAGDLLFNTECYAIADNVGYARGEIRRAADDGLVAFGSATFMLDTRGPQFFTDGPSGESPSGGGHARS